MSGVDALSPVGAKVRLSCPPKVDREFEVFVVVVSEPFRHYSEYWYST